MELKSQKLKIEAGKSRLK